MLNPITFRAVIGATEGNAHRDDPEARYFHLRTGTFATHEVLRAAGLGSDCILPVTTAPAATKPAGHLHLGDRIALDAMPGIPATTIEVRLLELVGDDVLINDGHITISRSNPVTLAEEASCTV